jgi:hypothetical protein
MKWLRQSPRGDEVAWSNDKYTAAQKADACHVLGDAIIIARHPYDRNPNSGSGNCWCGRSMGGTIHEVVMDSDARLPSNGQVPG